MARTYNEQAPDGSWRQVTQNDNGTYTTVPISPSQYQAANIPGGSSPGAASFTNPDGTINQAQFNTWLQQQGTSTAAGFTSGYATSLADQTSQLQAAGYNGPWDAQSVQQAYARTYGGGNAAQTGSTIPGVDSYNSAAGSAAYQAAALAAQTAYQNALIKGASDRLAFDEATQAFTQTMQTAQLTGTYNGNPTLAAQQQAEQNAIAQGQLAVSQGQLTGTYNGAPTLAAQQQNNTTALGYLGLLKGMSGPANAFDYAHVLTGTPGGLADIVRAAGGQYQMPAFGGGGNQAVAPLSIQSMINDVNRYSPTAATPGSSGANTGYVPTYAPPPAMPTEPTGGGLGSPNLPPQMGGTGPAPAPAQPPPAAPTGSPGLPTGSAGLGDPPQATGTGPPGGGQNLAVNLPVVRAYSPPQPTLYGGIITNPPWMGGTFPAPAPPGTILPGGTEPWDWQHGRPILQGSSGAPPSMGGSGAQTGGSYIPQYGGQAMPQASWNLPASQGQASQTGQSYIPQYSPTGSPSQLAPQAINRMSPSQLQLLYGAMGQGTNGSTPYLPADIQAMYQQSLKGWGGPAQGAVGF